MINLNLTRDQMLTEIKVSEKTLANCINNPADPGLVSPDGAHLVVHGKTPDELLPILNRAFSQRFARVPQERLIRDLSYPLKKGLGNAYKWGNQRDPAKSITVDAVVTNTGAVVAITDEGEGFDVKVTVGKFRNNEDFFLHGGSGFTHFQKAKSLISYANGGRTLLIRFLSLPESGKAVTAAQSSIYGSAGDAQFMKSLLAAELPCFRNTEATLESLNIYEPEKPKKDHAEIKYVLEFRADKSAELEKMILTGRLMPEIPAQTDYSVAEQLHRRLSNETDGIRIPEPVAVFKKPSLVLFKFNPSADLRDYLKRVTDLQDVVKVINVVAGGLRALHRSMIALENDESLDGAVERLRATRDRLVMKLSPACPQRVEQVQQVFENLVEHASALGAYLPAPIHGAFSWNCILHDDERFYFCHFEDSRRSHPGFDSGGFLADLLRFYVLRKKGNQEYYRAGCETFLKTYFADDLAPWHEELSFFIAFALFLRLDRLLKRSEKKWQSKVDALLEQCEQIL